MFWTADSGACRGAVCGPSVQTPTLTLTPPLPDSKITNVPQYPISAAAQNRVSEVTADLEKRQIITSTHFPYNSPVWWVQKPDRGGI